MQIPPDSNNNYDPTPLSTIKTSAYPLALAQRTVRTSSGTVGTTILISTNYFSIQLGKIDRAIHYHVAINPDGLKKALRRCVMDEFQRKHYPNRYPAFDGAKSLYSSTELPFGDEFRDDNITIRVDDKDRTYRVVVKFFKYIDLSSLRSYFSAGDQLINAEDAMRCINAILKSAPALTCISPKRASFARKSGEILRLADGMELYCGFKQSAILGWKPFLNVNVSHKKLITTNQPVTTLIVELYGLENEQQLKDFEADWTLLEKSLKALRVRSEIPDQPFSKKKYRVNGLGKSPIEEVCTLGNKPPITVFVYFKTRKGYTVKYPRLPCLWVGNQLRGTRTLVPAELCSIIEGQQITKGLNAISTNPTKRMIMDAVQAVQYNASPGVREFGFSVGDDFERVDARVLPPPQLMYNERKSVTPVRGVWHANNRKFVEGAVLKRWTICCLDKSVGVDTLGRLANMVSENIIFV